VRPNERQVGEVCLFEDSSYFPVLDKQSESQPKERSRWPLATITGLAILVSMAGLLLEGASSFWWVLPLLTLNALQLLSAFFGPHFLSYRLTDDGVQIRSLARRRIITYSNIDTVLVTTFRQSWGLQPLNSHGYYVGLQRSEHWGYADIACSTASGEAVALVLRVGRPVLFTPIDPERIADEIRARMRRKQ